MKKETENKNILSSKMLVAGNALRVISTCNSHIVIEGNHKAVCGYWVTDRLNGGKGHGNANVTGEYVGDKNGRGISCYRCKAWIAKHFQ